MLNTKLPQRIARKNCRGPDSKTQLRKIADCKAIKAVCQKNCRVPYANEGDDVLTRQTEVHDVAESATLGLIIDTEVKNAIPAYPPVRPPAGQLS